MVNGLLKLTSAFAICLCVAGCHKNPIEKGGSPTAPSTTPDTRQPTTPAVDFRTQSFTKVGRFGNDNKFYIQHWGNLNLLQDLTSLNGGDWNGTTFYHREYLDNGNRRVAYIVQFANSTPIGDTNVTLIRDIETDGKVDFDLLIAPKDRAGKELPRITVTFANKGNVDRFRLDPTNLSINGESRVQGPLPAVATLTQLHNMRTLGTSFDPIPDLDSVPPAEIYSIEERKPDGSYRTTWHK